MYGHLRMGHGLRGEELEQAYQQTQSGGSSPREVEEAPEPADTHSRDLPEVPTSPSREQETRKEKRPADDREPVEKAKTGRGNDPVSEAADRLRRAKERLRAVKEKTGAEVEQEKESPGALSKLLGLTGLEVNLLGKTQTETTVERTEAEQELCQECREEVEAAERELEKALEHEQVDRRYARTDT